MNRLPFALATLLPLLACTTDQRSFSTSGSTGAGAASATSSSGAGSGAGGGAGGGGSCTPSGNPFDVMTNADIGSYQLKNQILVVPQTVGGQPFVHVVVADQDGAGTLVRSLLSGDVNPVKNLVNVVGNGVVGAGPSSYQPGLAWAGTTSLELIGKGGQAIETMTFVVDKNQGVTSPPTSSTLPAPSSCGAPLNMQQAVFTVDSTGSARYLGTCISPTAGMVELVLGNPDGTTDHVLTGSPTDLTMSPMLYAFVNGTHFATFQEQQGWPSYSYGPDAASFAANLKQFALNTTANSLNGIFSAVPTTKNDGLVFFAGEVPESLTDGQIWIGSLATGKLGTLADEPSPLTKVAAITTLVDFASLNVTATDGQHIYSAGAAQDLHSIKYSLFDRKGTPIVLESLVASEPDVNVIAAAGAPFDTTSDLVVWIETSTDTAGALVQTVRGQRLLCHGG